MSASATGVHRRWLTLSVAVAVVLVVDQLTKWWAVRTLAPPPEGDGRIIDLVGSLRFRYAENTGMAFSKGADSGNLIGVLVLVIVVVMVVAASRATSRAQVALLGVVIGGALGNLVDRLARAGDGLLSGAVVDFVDLQWWPVFNVADAAVVCGGILLVIVTMREPDASPADPEGSQDPPESEDRGDPTVPPAAEDRSDPNTSGTDAGLPDHSRPGDDPIPPQSSARSV